MKAIILAAGYGTRLGNITRNLPKPMIDIGGKPVIEHILTRLAEYEITEIMVNVHYLSEIITDYLKNRVMYYHEPELLGHAGTIHALQNWLSGDFMVINGDTLNEINYSKMIAAHKLGTITAHMDEWRCCGTWIYSSEYFDAKNLPVYPYRDGSRWFDIGNPARLEYARGYYDAKSTHSMP